VLGYELDGRELPFVAPVLDVDLAVVELAPVPPSPFVHKSETQARPKLHVAFG
jgi:hypothetical protein